MLTSACQPQVPFLGGPNPLGRFLDPLHGRAGGLITHHSERTVGHLIQLLFLWIHCDRCLWWACVHACPGDFLSTSMAIPGYASAGTMKDPNVRSMSMVPNHTPSLPLPPAAPGAPVHIIPSAVIPWAYRF